MLNTEATKEAMEAGICLSLFRPSKAPTPPPETEIAAREITPPPEINITTPNLNPYPEVEMALNEVPISPEAPIVPWDEIPPPKNKIPRLVTPLKNEVVPQEVAQPPKNKMIPRLVTKLSEKNVIPFAVTPRPSKTENLLCDSTKKYNLRSKQPDRMSICMTHRAKKFKYQANPPKWITKADDDFRDPILTEVDIHCYHPQIEDEFAKKVITITSVSNKSQLDRFVYSSKKFIAICWLTTMRIFEYLPDKEHYFEVKRIPNRFISLSPQLLTSIHCDNSSRFYLAYLWGCQKEDADVESSYVEVRDIYGKSLIDKPFFYNDVVKEIYSDNMYIYVRLSSNVIYLHRKNFFDTMFYCIDFNDKDTAPEVNTPLTSFWVVSTTFDSYTKLVLLTATSSQLLLSKYNISSHRIIRQHNFTECPNFTIVSIDKYRKDFIIHRNARSIKSDPLEEYLSKVDIGSISNRGYTFEPHIQLSFQYHILQVRLHKDCIYLFGYRENRDGIKDFELGCLSIKGLDPKPRWTTYLNGVDINTKILVHSDNIAIIKSNQQVSSISTISRDRNECRCCKLGFLRKEDLQIHERSSPKSMFGFKFGLNKIQMPPKKIGKLQILDSPVLSLREEGNQNNE